MPSSNYGSIIDINAPQNIQNLYSGQSPDFVFQANDAKNQKKRIVAIIDLALTLVIISIIVTSSLPYYDLLIGKITQYGTDYADLIKAAKTQYANDPETTTGLLIGGGIIASLISISLLKNIIKNTTLVFTNKKIWYIGTPQNLTIVEENKSQYLDWKQVKEEIIMESGPFGDTLKLQLKPGKFGKELVFTNPPNIMEIKRLMENRIKENQIQEFKKEENNPENSFPAEL